VKRSSAPDYLSAVRLVNQKTIFCRTPINK
jgi:hypothetical protein